MSMIKAGLLVVTAALLIGLSACGDPEGSRVDDTPPTEGEYTVSAEYADKVYGPDVEFYAERAGLDIDEATMRMATSLQMGEYEALISENEPAYAGSWIQHEPEYRYIFAFTENGEEILDEYIDDPFFRQMVDLLEFDYPLDELIETRLEVTDTLNAAGINFRHVLNMKDNSVDIFCADRDTAERKLKGLGIDLPGSVRLLQDDNLEIPDELLSKADWARDETNRAALIGSAWEAVAMDGKPIPVNDPVTLNIGENGRFGGNSGCNNYGGYFSQKGYFFRTGEIDQTCLGCGEVSNEFESRFISNLMATYAFSLSDDYLTLYNEAGNTLIVFEKVQ